MKMFSVDEDHLRFGDISLSSPQGRSLTCETESYRSPDKVRSGSAAHKAVFDTSPSLLPCTTL